MTARRAASRGRDEGLAVGTVTVGVLQIQGRFFYDYPGLMAGLLIISLPVIGVYILFQRYLVQAIAAGALK